MNADKRWTFSDGTTFSTRLDTLLYLKNNPELRVVLTQVSDEGVTSTDVTEAGLALLNDHPYGTAR